MRQAATAHIEWRVGLLRLYAPGKSYEARDQYIGTCLVEVLDDGEVFLAGLRADNMNRETRHAIFMCLAEAGFTKIHAVRGPRRVEFDILREIERHQKSDS